MRIDSQAYIYRIKDDDIRYFRGTFVTKTDHSAFGYALEVGSELRK